MENYDRGYFEGDDQSRGYRGEGYRDFACHHATAQAILAEKPESVIEIGAGRGYISKLIQNAGVNALPMDISMHCYHTRAVDAFAVGDITKTPWLPRSISFKNKQFDLSFSIAVLEHIPDDQLDAVIKEIARVSKRGLHAPSVERAEIAPADAAAPGPTSPPTKPPSSPDASHTTLRTIQWWEDRFKAVAPDYPVKIMDKEDLELHGDMAKIMQVIPRETRIAAEGGDRRSIKINFGSFVNMFYYGWLNVDAVDLDNFAFSNGYLFMRYDVTKQLPFPDGYADLIFSSHLIEHLSREEGVRFMGECFRILKPGGTIRIATPDTQTLAKYYAEDLRAYRKLGKQGYVGYDEGLKKYRHVNPGVEKSFTPLDAFSNLALSGHKSIYDRATLTATFEGAGFKTIRLSNPFKSDNDMMTRETIVSHPTLSLVMEAVK